MEETLTPARILRAILIGVALFLAGAGVFIFIFSNIRLHCAACRA